MSAKCLVKVTRKNGSPIANESIACSFGTFVLDGNGCLEIDEDLAKKLIAKYKNMSIASTFDEPDFVSTIESENVNTMFTEEMPKIKAEPKSEDNPKPRKMMKK